MKVVIRAKNHDTKRYRKAFEHATPYQASSFIDSEHFPSDLNEVWLRIDSINILGDAVYISVTPPRRKKAQETA